MKLFLHTPGSLRYVSFCRAAILVLILNVHISSSAQCGSGYTRDTINWDYFDFLHRSGGFYAASSPFTSLPFVTTAMTQTQYFGVAGNRVTFTNTNSLPVGQSGVYYGDISTHTGEANSFGNGDDIKFSPLASPATYSMTFSFQTAVQDVKLSLYDIDVDQRITVTALNGATPVNITMAKISGSILTINGSGTTSANAKASGSAAANNSTDGTANVTITGSVTSFTIAVSETTIKLSGQASGQDDGGFYLSDISACFANPSFPTNYYYNYTQPFTNQPAYFLANPQNLSVYMVNSSNGVADLLFTDDGLDGQKMNSIAYDPVNKWVYYVMDNYSDPHPVNPSENRKLKKYDVNTETISTVIPDLRTFGIPTMVQGVEFAGAAFYNGSLYLGIEESDGDINNTGGESVIWKIDFDGSGNPTTYAQVFALPGDNGGGLRRHDWGDFVIKDGVLISHATYEPAAFSSTNVYVHYDLQAGTAVTYNGDATVSGQLGQIYDGRIYRVKNNLALYNNNGMIGATTPITVNSCSPVWINDAGDASDPFKPKCDFGDAPSTYDPVALSPAANQKACNNSTLRIGSAWDREWTLGSSSNASGDGTDEDGISTVTIMVSDGVPYNHVQDVTVLNNTGATAYLAGWLDYNANGVFDASEGVVATVPSSASPQTISLGWMGITVASGTPNSFLRVRLYSGTLTVNDATGWLSDGETEDYPVLSQSYPLFIQLLDFNATLTRDKDVFLSWKANADKDDPGFEVQRSSDQQTWEKIKWVDLNTSTSTADYSILDDQPIQGRSYYRLKMVERSGSSKYSATRTIYIDQLRNSLKVYPNPAKNDMNVSFNSNVSQQATLVVTSLAGEMMMKKPLNINQGDNLIKVSLSGFSNGLYIVELVTTEKKYINKLSITH